MHAGMCTHTHKQVDMYMQNTLACGHATAGILLIEKVTHDPFALFFTGSTEILI